MTQATENGSDDRLATLDVDTEIERIDVKAIAVLNRSELEAQIDCAHKYPRSVARFLREAQTLATLTRETAESCIYSVPRDGKMISGPSVRLAEVSASAYTNLHIAARVVDVEDTVVIAMGVAWDIEKNLRVTVETRRRITSKSGRRYNEDMIVMTGNAAASIALRNAIFRVIPRAYIDTIYGKVKLVAVGDAQTLVARRQEVIVRLGKIGVPPDRVLARLGKPSVEDVGLEELELLIGLGTAIKNGDQAIDDAFPASAPAPAAPSEDGKRISMKGKKADAKDEPVVQDREPAPEQQTKP